MARDGRSVASQNLSSHWRRGFSKIPARRNCGVVCSKEDGATPPFASVSPEDTEVALVSLCGPFRKWIRGISSVAAKMDTKGEGNASGRVFSTLTTNWQTPQAGHTVLNGVRCVGLTRQTGLSSLAASSVLGQNLSYDERVSCNLDWKWPESLEFSKLYLKDGKRFDKAQLKAEIGGKSLHVCAPQSSDSSINQLHLWSWVPEWTTAGLIHSMPASLTYLSYKAVLGVERCRAAILPKPGHHAWLSSFLPWKWCWIRIRWSCCLLLFCNFTQEGDWPGRGNYPWPSHLCWRWSLALSHGCSDLCSRQRSSWQANWHFHCSYASKRHNFN